MKLETSMKLKFKKLKIKLCIKQLTKILIIYLVTYKI